MNHDKNTPPMHARWSKPAAILGAAALMIGGAALPAAAAEPTTDPESATIDLVDHGFDEVIDDGQDPIADPAFEEPSLAGEEATFVPTSATANAALNDTAAAPVPGDPVTGSRPDANVTLYLDFDGEVLEGTAWNDDAGIESFDFAPAVGLDVEGIWASVAEDYAPYDVNVTTTRPSDEDLYKTSDDDERYGVHVIITDSYDDGMPGAGTSSGIAYIDAVGDEYRTGALVYTEGITGDPDATASVHGTADTASHEAGHNFGLEHAGFEDEEYYAPSEGVWSPIMGGAFEIPLSQWTMGEYAGATSTQDELATIANRSAAGHQLMSVTLPDGTPYEENAFCVESGDVNDPQPGDVFYAVNAEGTCNPPGEQLVLNFTYSDRADFVADAVGDTAGESTVLDNASGSAEVEGLIERTDDVDVYRIDTAGGSIEAAVEVPEVGPNLNALLTLTDADGAEIAAGTEQPERVSAGVVEGMGSSLTADVDAGTYYLTVDGVGAGDPTTATSSDANGFTEYGSLGNYTLTATAEPLVSEEIAITSPEDGDEVEGGADLPVTGTATPNAEVTLTVGGEVVDTVTADESGAWTGTVTAAAYGETTIEAAQSIDGVDLPGTASVTVVSPVDAPVITAPEDGSTVETAEPEISGTGIAGATVDVTVTGPDGDVTASTTVADDGTWSVQLDGLTEGDYSVVATQSIGGVTSDASATTEFAIEIPSTTTPPTDTPDPSETPDPTPPGDGGDDGDTTLPVTGTNVDLGLLIGITLAVLIMGSGAVAAGLRHRKLMAQD